MTDDMLEFIIHFQYEIYHMRKMENKKKEVIESNIVIRTLAKKMNKIRQYLL